LQVKPQIQSVRGKNHVKSWNIKKPVTTIKSSHGK